MLDSIEQLATAITSNKKDPETIEGLRSTVNTLEMANLGGYKV